VALGAGDVGAVPAGRRVDTGGGLLGGGGTLTGDLTLTLTPASVEEANAGAAGDRVVTPASLSAILATLAGKASGAATVSAGGLLKGGNRIEANPALWLDAASPETSSRAPPATGRSRPPRSRACRAASPPMAGSPCPAGCG
jgi:hypothetical protein